MLTPLSCRLGIIQITVNIYSQVLKATLILVMFDINGPNPIYLLRHTIERLVGGNFELYFVRVALARQTLKHTSDGVTAEPISTRHRQLQIKHL